MQSITDTVKAAAAAIDPRQPAWEIPSLSGKTVIITGGNSGVATPAADCVRRSTQHDTHL